MTRRQKLIARLCAPHEFKSLEEHMAVFKEFRNLKQKR